MDDLLAALARSGRTRPIPTRVKRHLARVGSWYPDVRTHTQYLTQPEAKALVTSAEEIVQWMSEEAV